MKWQIGINVISRASPLPHGLVNWAYKCWPTALDRQWQNLSTMHVCLLTFSTGQGTTRWHCLVMKRLKSPLVAATRLCECVDFQMVQNNVGITETTYMWVTATVREQVASLKSTQTTLRCLHGHYDMTGPSQCCAAPTNYPTVTQCNVWTDCILAGQRRVLSWLDPSSAGRSELDRRTSINDMLSVTVQ